MSELNIKKPVRGTKFNLGNFQVEKSNEVANPGSGITIKKSLTPKKVPTEGFEFLANPLRRSKTPKSILSTDSESDNINIESKRNSGSSGNSGNNGGNKEFRIKNIESKTEDSDDSDEFESESGESEDSGESSEIGDSPVADDDGSDDDGSDDEGSDDEGSDDDDDDDEATNQTGKSNGNSDFLNTSSGDNKGEDKGIFSWLFGGGNEEKRDRDYRHMNFQEIQKEKLNLISKIERLEAKGFRARCRFTPSSDLDEIRDEYRRLRHQATLQGSIQFYRDSTVFVASGGEMVNNFIGNPLGLKLDGWSQQLQTEVYTKYEYDEIFEELHDKYGGSSSLPPEVRLLMMVGGSAAMFHTTKMITESLGGGIMDVLKARPDLHSQLVQATMQQGAQNVGINQANPMMGMMNQGIGMQQGQPPGPPPGPQMYSGMPPMGQGRPQAVFGMDPSLTPGMTAGPPPPMDTRNMSGNGGRQMMPPPPQGPPQIRTPPPTGPPAGSRRGQMRGPQGVDDLLESLKSSRPPVSIPPRQQSDARSVMTSGTATSGRRRRKKDDDRTITLDF